MLKLLFAIIIICSSAGLSAGSCDQCPCDGKPVAEPSTTTNCNVGKDSGCESGFCGIMNVNSPVNISNLFGVVLNDLLDLGTPTYVLDRLSSVILGDANTEGAYVSINNCNGDWLNCQPYVYICSNNLQCPYSQCSKDRFCRAEENFTILPNKSSACKASPNMAKPAVNQDTFLTDSKGNQLYCPLMRGNIPTSDFWFYMNMKA